MPSFRICNPESTEEQIIRIINPVLFSIGLQIRCNGRRAEIANPMQRATGDYIFVVEMLNNYINNLLTLIKNYHYD